MKIKGQTLNVDIEFELSRFEFDKAIIKDGKMLACSPFRSEQTPSFFIRLVAGGGFAEGVWHDSGGSAEYTSGNFISLIAYLDGISYEEAEEYLLDAYGENTHELRLTPPCLELAKPQAYINAETITPFVGIHEYLTNRGISETVQQQMKTGFDKQRKSILIPWFDAKGRLANVKYRRIDNKIFYYQKGGVAIQKLVFGINQIRKSNAKVAFLCESEIDALTLMSHGYSALALGGSHFTRDKANIIKSSSIERLIIATDNDRVGTKVRTLVAESLENYVSVLHAYVPAPFKDVNECNDAAIFYEMFQNAKKEQKNISF